MLKNIAIIDVVHEEPETDHMFHLIKNALLQFTDWLTPKLKEFSPYISRMESAQSISHRIRRGWQNPNHQRERANCLSEMNKFHQTTDEIWDLAPSTLQ